MYRIVDTINTYFWMDYPDLQSAMKMFRDKKYKYELYYEDYFIARNF